MTEPASFLFENVHAFTADPRRPSAEAVAVRADRIVFAGSRAQARAFAGARTRVVDGGGGTLLPGFIDCHFHLLYGALNLDGMQLEPAASYEQLAVIVRAYAAGHPEDAWLAGTGARYQLGPGGTPLDRHALDALVADRPIYINAYDGHTSWGNSVALQRAGLFHGGNTGPNSEIVVDAAGEATGELREPGAYQALSDLVPKPDAARRRALVQQALHLTAGFGVTSVHNMDNSGDQAGLYAALEAAGELTCRIYLAYSVSPQTRPAAFLEEVLPLQRSLTGGRLRAGAVKFFIDGVIESYTGMLVDPYADAPSTRGAGNYDPETYRRLVTEADRLGLQIFTHSVGDRGVRTVLDAYEHAARVNAPHERRHRVEHIELIHPDDVARFRSLGVVASMQPLHAPARVDETDIWPLRVGRGRWPLSFAWRTLRAAGATLVFGSDWPVVTQNPLKALGHAVGRQPWEPGMPDQRQTLTEALLSYTRDAARSEFQEHQKGSIKEGYLADLVLLPADLFTLEPAAIAGLQPVLTMLDGQVVFEGA